MTDPWVRPLKKFDVRAAARKRVLKSVKSNIGFSILFSISINAVISIIPAVLRKMILGESQPQMCPVVTAINIENSPTVNVVVPAQSNFSLRFGFTISRK